MNDTVDTIEVKLPTSGKVVTIRNYTTHADDKAYNDALYLGVTVDADSKLDTSFKLPVSNSLEAKAVNVRRLVKDIDGDDTNIREQLDELRKEDYDAIFVAVEKVVDANSPKVKAA